MKARASKARRSLPPDHLDPNAKVPTESIRNEFNGLF
jgi:hypothetical protein